MARFVAVVLFAVLLLPRLALAQDIPYSLRDLQSRVQVGDTLRLVDTAGTTLQGRLEGLSGNSLGVMIHGIRREFLEAAIREVQLRNPDPIANGTRMGSVVGAAVGILSGLAASGEGCESSSCTTGSAILFGGLGAGIGAAVGAFVDSTQQSYSTVFLARKLIGGRFGITPMFAKDARGVQVSLRL